MKILFRENHPSSLERRDIEISRMFFVASFFEEELLWGDLARNDPSRHFRHNHGINMDRENCQQRLMKLKGKKKIFASRMRYEISSREQYDLHEL